MTQKETVPAAAAGQETEHPFDRAIRLEPCPEGGALRGRTSDQYWNVVGPFGGITTAVVLNALQDQSERLGDPLSLTVNFAGPVKEGEFIIEPRLLRTNRSTQHWGVEMYQGAERECVINAVAVFAARRPTWGVTEVAGPELPGPETIPRMVNKAQVKWPDCYDMRLVRGHFAQGVAGTDTGDSLTQLWISDFPARRLDFPALASICDAFFPRIFVRRAGFVAIGTVSLNIHFHLGSEELAGIGSEPVLGVVQSQVFHQGFFDQVGQLWSRDKRLLATTQQIVWYKR